MSNNYYHILKMKTIINVLCSAVVAVFIIVIIGVCVRKGIIGYYFDEKDETETGYQALDKEANDSADKPKEEPIPEIALIKEGTTTVSEAPPTKGEEWRKTICKFAK